MRIALIIVLALAWVPGIAAGRNNEAEIQHLLSAVGDSGCSFLRNGEVHSSSDAEAHLRMKYRRGKGYASTAEKFIERLASGSSMSKKPYMIICGETEPVPTGDWFFDRLKDYREDE